MSITLALEPEMEERLREMAARQGKPVETYLLDLAERDARNGTRSNPAAPNGAPPLGSLAEMFAQWREEDATDDPEELRRADEELEELKANLNANRAANGERLLFP